MDIKLPSKIHIAICEKIFPKLEVYISKSLDTAPESTPTASMHAGVNVHFLTAPSSLRSHMAFPPLRSETAARLCGKSGAKRNVFRKSNLRAPLASVSCFGACNGSPCFLSRPPFGPGQRPPGGKESLPSTAASRAPVTPGRTFVRPMRQQSARIAKATASFASLERPSASCVSTRTP